jgi:hypothetical protein
MSKAKEFGPPLNPRGRRLDAEELEKIPHIRAKAPAKYAWAAGTAMSRFLEELKNGRIIGRKCARCHRVLVPPADVLRALLSAHDRMGLSAGHRGRRDVLRVVHRHERKSHQRAHSRGDGGVRWGAAALRNYALFRGSLPRRAQDRDARRARVEAQGRARRLGLGHQIFPAAQEVREKI